MTKKQLEEKVLQLERELSEFKSQMLTLALRPMSNSFPPYTGPVINPFQPSWPQPNYPTITWGNQIGQNIA